MKSSDSGQEPYIECGSDSDMNAIKDVKVYEKADDPSISSKTTLFLPQLSRNDSGNP